MELGVHVFKILFWVTGGRGRSKAKGVSTWEIGVPGTLPQNCFFHGAAEPPEESCPRLGYVPYDLIVEPWFFLDDSEPRPQIKDI